MFYIDPRTGTILFDVVDLEDEDRSAVLKHLDVKDLVIISTLSLEVKAVVNNHFVRNLERTLASFVPSPLGLRDALRSSRAVISGSLALWFIIGGADCWFPHDCDIYTPLGEAEALHSYLRSHAGYEPDASRKDFVNDSSESEYEDSSSPDPRANPSIASVQHLINGTRHKIDIIESSNASALFPLPRFWSTILPNYISADSLCCPYPFLTLRHQGCLCLADMAPVAPVLRAMEKYKDRHFVIRDFNANITPFISYRYPQISEGCQDNPYCPHTRRYFGDKWCLQFAFDDRAASAPVDRYTTRWRYGSNQCGGCSRQSSFEVDVVRRAGASSQSCSLA